MEMKLNSRQKEDVRNRMTRVYAKRGEDAPGEWGRGLKRKEIKGKEESSRR